MARAFRLAEIAERFGGLVVGNPDTCVDQVASLESAGQSNIAFLSNAKYRKLLDTTKAGALILPASGYETPGRPAILCDNPYLYFAQVSCLFNPPPQSEPGIHPSSVIHPDAVISPHAQISAGSFIGADAIIEDGAVVGAGSVVERRAHIGALTRLDARVTIYESCRIGQRGLVHAGAVIGADGFGLAQQDGKWLKIPQVGSVRIGDDVEIGANTTIDRGAMDDTILNDGVKLDNQIQVGHNVVIGAHTAIAGCVGIAGSAKIGRHCTIGGGAIILGHLTIADHVNISAGTLVAKSIHAAGTYTGVFPLDTHREWLHNAAHIRHLYSLSDRIAALEIKERQK